MAGGVGFVLARLLSAAELDAWGWRVALLLGGVLVPLGIFVRQRLPETLEAAGQRLIPAAREPLPRRLLVRSLMVLSGGTMCGYTISYMTTFAQDTLHLGANAAFGTPIAEGVAAICLAPLGGWLSDRAGRKPVALTGLCALLLLVVPCYYAMVSWHSAWLVYGVTALLSGLMGIFYVPAFTAIVESLPRGSRSGAVSILYAVAGAMFGGFTQFSVKWLLETTGSPSSPAWYMVAGLVMAASGMIGFRESAPCKTSCELD
jgi:MFS family permease